MQQTPYQKVREIWKNKPDKSTPIMAEDIMHIEQGIYNNSIDIIELSKSIGGSGTTDVTEQCTISTNGLYIVEVVVPLDTILTAISSHIMVGGEFLGLINFSSRPSMLFNAQISGIISPASGVTKINGKAVLVNLFSSTVDMFGYKFEGAIEFDSNSQPKAKITFDLSSSPALATLTSGSVIYKTSGSATDFSITQIYEDLSDKIKEIPSKYVTNEKLEEYAQPKGDYASVSDIPTKTSDLENDSGYLTGEDVISTNNVLRSIEELEANTEEGYLVDALVVKEILAKFAGTWIAFSDAEGTEKDEPYIHWNEEEG